MKNQLIGGPHHKEVTCASCGKKWTRYIKGSHDWQYKNCLNCELDVVTNGILKKKQRRVKK